MSGGRRSGYLEERGDRRILAPRLPDIVALPFALAFVVAPAVLLAASLGAWLMAGGDGTAFALGWGIGAAMAAGLAMVGLASLATVGTRRARATVELDLAERLLLRRGRSPEVLRGVRGVAVRRAGFGLSLELWHDDTRVTKLLRAPRGAGRALAAAAERLAEALDADIDVPASVRHARPILPETPHVAAALCYAPFDGVFVVVSLYYLATSSDPLVRFSAKQSLLGFVVEALAALAVLGCCGAPFALVLPDRVAPLGVAFTVLALMLARIFVRTVAAARAHRGRVWIQPWLAPLARRWAPPPPPGSTW